MFCPEDGTPIKHQGDGCTYPPCPQCLTIWHYDGEHGRYEVWHGPTGQEEVPWWVMRDMEAVLKEKESGADMPKGWVEELLKESGEAKRALGTDVLVANIVDALEKEAMAKGSATYYLGTYAVARGTLATVGLTCEVTTDPRWQRLPLEGRFRWISFFGDDREELTRQEAIESLLAERS